MDVELLINKKKFFLLMVARGGNCPFTSTTSLSISHQYHGRTPHQKKDMIS